MQRFSNSPIVPFILFRKNRFSILFTLIVITCLVNDTQILLEADNHVFQSFIYIFGKCFPRFINNPLIAITILRLGTQHMLQIIARCLAVFTCRLIIQIVDNISACTCYHNSIHRMMSVVNTFFTESFLQMKRHGRYHTSASIDRCEIGSSRLLIHPFKTWQHNLIPNIIDSPIFLQPVGHSTRTYHNMP